MSLRILTDLTEAAAIGGADTRLGGAASQVLQRGLVGADLGVHRREVVLALLVALALALVDVVLRHQLLDGLEVDGEVLRFLLQLRGHLRNGVLDADLAVVAGRGVRVEERLRFGGLRGELLTKLGVGGGGARWRDLADVGLLWSGGVEYVRARRGGRSAGGRRGASV